MAPGLKTTSEAVRLGAEHYVKKPIVINFLLSTLARLAAVQSEPIPRCSAPRISEPYAFVRLAQKAAQSLTSKGEAFDFTEFLAVMVVVEARIFRARQAQNGLAGALRQPTAAGLAAVGVS